MEDVTIDISIFEAETELKENNELFDAREIMEHLKLKYFGYLQSLDA